jgi:adenylate kinase family enzyme
MQRVAVIGNAGGGKSTLTRALAAKSGLPLYPVDKVQWQPGWQAVPEAEVTAALDAYAAEPRWVIDGWGP